MTSQLSRSSVLPYIPIVPSHTSVAGQCIPIDEYADETLDDTQPVILMVNQLDFRVTRIIGHDHRIVAVMSVQHGVLDHVRKILQESQIAAGVLRNGDEQPCSGDFVYLNTDSVSIVRPSSVTISAINTTLTERSVKTYRDWNINHLGYFRNKFVLFDLWAQHPEAFDDNDRARQFLVQKLLRVAEQGWATVRVVLSDPSSHELRSLGVRHVAEETNPDMGLRGPRVFDRWKPELAAVAEAARLAPEVRFSICVPFVSNAAEWAQAASRIAEIVGAEIAIGFTLEIPSMWLDLERAIAARRPAFVGIGTSDLLAFVNGADRDVKVLRPDFRAPHNTEVIFEVARKAAHHGVPFFVCGDVRRDADLMGELITIGATEFLTSSDHREICTVYDYVIAATEVRAPAPTPSAGNEQKEIVS